MLRALSNPYQQAGARLIVTKQKPRNRPNGPGRAQSPILAKNSADRSPWLWGTHAVLGALANPRRQIKRLVATENAARRAELGEADICTAREIDRLLPAGAVHQGIALETDPLATIGLSELTERAPRRIGVLDQVTDPHNLGAVFRSAAAFGVDALIMQSRNAPPITGVAAKSAAGAVECVAECRVVNIARALSTLEQAGYCVIGLSGDASVALGDVIPEGEPVVMVFGAEGAGLRPAVANACTWLAYIPIDARMESLNISNAAAIAFYEAGRRPVS